MGPEERKLQNYISEISPPDESVRASARVHWASLAHPLDGLGLLEADICDIAALTGSVDIYLHPAAALVFCSDNGVVGEGISQTDASVTGIVAKNIIHDRTSVCRMAKSAGVSVAAVDMGIRDFSPEEGTNHLISRRIGNGTYNIRQGPAMSREQAAAAVNAGIELAGLFCGNTGGFADGESGEFAGNYDKLPGNVSAYRLLGAGEMGIGNTTTAAAVLSVLLNRPADAVTGRGAGLSDDILKRKVQVVADAVALNRPDPLDPLDILSKVGGFDIGGMCGLYLGGAKCRVPVLIDGIISSTAALLAYAFNKNSAKAMIASHVSSEPLAADILETLGKKPLITAGMHLGEATGAVAAMPLLFMAEAVYKDSYTFSEGKIKSYEKYN
ncbi:MAG: nicotinate-nucleotide--dimethylbenzimidazole phosphoribosyltransferase [Lachnospiraceae bacterium]|nr:nicotinate-nucleotide--dimethylbenzimidazole phosphoribosyltransferase [Lachnospiraceae bacterium]